MKKEIVLAIVLGAPAAWGDEQAARLAAGVKAADAAIAALQGRLSARLMEEMRTGGPARAVAVVPPVSHAAVAPSRPTVHPHAHARAQ